MMHSLYYMSYVYYGISNILTMNFAGQQCTKIMVERVLRLS